jgi:hypothetical protein
MKSNVMPSIVKIEANQLKELVNEVRETVATNMVQVKSVKRNKANFGIVDLWNIRRGAKTARRNWSI